MYALLPPPRSPSRQGFSGLGDLATDLVSASLGAGQVDKAEAASIASLWDGVKAGTLTSDQVNAAASKAASVASAQAVQMIPQAQSGSKSWDSAAALAATGATAAFGATGVLAPVAPLAGVVASQMVLAFKPRPIPPFSVEAHTNYWVQAMGGNGQCADQQCFYELRALYAPIYEEFNYYHNLDCAVTSSWLGLKHEGPSDPDCMVDAGAVASQKIDAAMPKAAEIVARSKLRVEIAFLEKVKKNADAIIFDNKGRCVDASCRQWLQGAAFRVAFDSAMEARNNNLASAKAKAQAGLDEIQGYISGKQTDLYRDQADQAQTYSGAVASSKTKKRVAVAVVGIGAAVALAAVAIHMSRGT